MRERDSEREGRRVRGTQTDRRGARQRLRRRERERERGERDRE